MENSGTNQAVKKAVNFLPPLASAWLVGGTVRDIILNRQPKDIDIAVLENPGDTAEKIATKTRGRVVELGKAEQGSIDKVVYRVAAKGLVVDVAKIRGANIIDDLGLRDFTMNAVAWDLEKGGFVDSTSGIADINASMVRMTNRDVFKSDPLRLVRAFRMAAVFGFSIEPETMQAITEDENLIKTTAGERIRYELARIFESGMASRSIREMADTGLLFSIFPEMLPTKGLSQNRFHEFDVLEHSLTALDNLEQLLKNPVEELKCAVSLSEKESSLLKFACLVHDIGKPATKKTDEKGRTRFIGHEKIGAELFKNTAHRLRLSNAEKVFITNIIENHIAPLNLFIAHEKNELTQKGRTRFFKRNGEHSQAILIHALADSRAKSPEPGNDYTAFRDFIRSLFKEYSENFIPKFNTPPLLTGSDLMNTLELAPSPEFSKILNAVEEARLAGEISTKDEAVALAKSLLLK